MSLAFDNEGLAVHEVRDCYLCHGRGERRFTHLRDRLYSAPGLWDIVQCPVCGLAWLNPLPNIESLDRLYAEYYTHVMTDQTLGYPRRIEHIARMATHYASILSLGYTQVPLRRRERIAGRLMSAIGPLRDVACGGIMWLPAKPGGRLLDIGSGSGQFLARMRTLGWEVNGLDPDAAAVEAAEKNYQITSYHGTVEEAHFPDNSFDAVTMNHVIEHLYDPIETLRECMRILKPGGKLIVVTPNTESLCQRRFGEHWLAWDPPRHLHIFTPRTLRRCVQEAGLQMVQLRTSARTAGVLWRASTFIRLHKPYPGGVRPIRDLWPRLFAVLVQIVEHGLSRIMPVGEELVMIATKAA